ncbi:hypothetical protein BT63DRAFT_247661 [Microthyrium microscopicum]|uniref:Uncharacterized protein n=1 Tax=Microthyrium microscopicum TaxID=703497 RepID=A0A6A6UBM0_9PEZI|nr:hypothetical protein BT63DRAFT_247661 [Microthyrium microscopicum]
MQFLEDLYASKRPTLPERRSTARQPRSLRRDLPAGPETQNARDISSSSIDRRDRTSSTKRNSIFSRRKSTATTSSGESQKRSSGVPSQGGVSRRSSLAEMAVADAEGLKSKLLFGLHPGKKSGPRKSDPTTVNPDNDTFVSNKRDRKRDSHKRAASTGGNGHNSISYISAPFGFQHLAKIERPSHHKNDDGGLTEVNVITSPSQNTFSLPPQDLQTSLARRSQKRPPPLRPKRPDETVPLELLSPQYGMHSLRQIRSAETFSSASQRQSGTLQPGPPSPGFMTSPIPPRRSSRLPPSIPEATTPPAGHSRDPSTEMDFSGDWDRILPLYDRRHPSKDQETAPAIRAAHAISVPDKAAIPMAIPSPLFSPPLEKVLEEPEGPVTPQQPRIQTRYPAIRHAKSSPSISNNISPRDRTIPPLPQLPGTFNVPPIPQRPVSQGSDTLGFLSRRSFTINEDEETNGENVKDASRETGESSSSWEEDIDFCYKFAAEADCDFDWSNQTKFIDIDSSDDEMIAPPFPATFPQSKHQISSSFDSTSGSENGAIGKLPFMRQSILPGQESVPDLVAPGLSHSGSLNSLSVGTPAEKYGFQSLENIRPVSGSSVQRRSGDSFGMKSPQLPPLDLKHGLDSDMLYEELMAGFNWKTTHSPALPTLEPKAYAGFVPTPPLSQKSFNAERNIQVNTGPTSAPSHNPRLEKELPPLPPASPTAISPSKDLPPGMTVDSIVAQLRGSPAESPIERQLPQFRYTPPSRSNSQFDNLAPRPLMRRRLNQSPPPLPINIERADSNDTVITAIAIPLSPPDSPVDTDVRAGTTMPLSARSVSSTGGPLHPKSPSPMMFKHRAPSLPALHLQQTHKKAASSDGFYTTARVPSSPTPPSPGPPGQGGYSLFPPPKRSTGRPRRLTTGQMS